MGTIPTVRLYRADHVGHVLVNVADAEDWRQAGWLDAPASIPATDETVGDRAGGVRGSAADLSAADNVVLPPKKKKGRRAPASE